MIKQRYIVITTIFTFFMLSSIYGFEYFNAIDYDEERDYLETNYGNNYDEIQSYIATQLKSATSTPELATYKLLELHFLYQTNDYDLIYEKMDYVESILTHADLFDELISFYDIIINTSLTTGKYIEAYIYLEKQETLLSLVSRESPSLANLNKLLQISDAKNNLIQQYDFPHNTTSILVPHSKIALLDRAFDYNNVYFNFHSHLFNYYYVHQDYPEALSYTNIIIGSQTNIPHFNADYYTLLIRSAISYLEMNNFSSAIQTYHLIKQAPVPLTELQQIELLRFESKLLLKNRNEELSLHKLLIAQSKAESMNHMTLKVFILDDLIAYHTTLNNDEFILKYSNERDELQSSTFNIEGKYALTQTINQLNKDIVSSHSQYLIHEQAMQSQFTLVIIITALIALAGFYFLYYIKRRHAQELNNQIHSLNKHLKDQLLYYQSKTDHQEHIRQIRHDLRHHHHTLLQLLDQSDYIRLRSYLIELGSHIEDKSHQHYADHPILDALIHSSDIRCQEKDIELTTQIHFPKEIEITDLAIITIFSNIIDNAIEACDNITHSNIPKAIDLVVTKQGNLVSIQISNTKQHKIIKKKDLLESTKKDKLLHGIGLTSVKNAIEPYGGILKFTYTESTFNLNILVRASRKEK